MPTQPTCKVVKRDGQRGARINPKGCKVRTTKDTQGNKRQYNKRGEEKITLKTTGNEMRLVVAGARQHSTVRNWGNRTMRQRAEWRDRHKMIYDTGAQVTSMSREMCDRLRIDWRRTTNYTMQSVRGVGNTSTPCKVLHDVEFYICIDAPLKVTAQWAKVKVDVYVLLIPESSTSNLIGVTAIRQLKSRFKLKFK